ncbi:MAG: tRNA pseudouridine(38-40) synthase TruA [Chloroflexi bacterium]|nr:tRNA pseudouridine(38-40) synthase TruA [Chloroflexota bacterium]
MTARATRYRGVLAYDGTDYYGFQRQAGNTPTIQGAVEAALQQITGQPITVVGAGRTDSGVHATGQVIAFDVAWRHTPADLWRAINATLPGSIALQTCESAPADFHPRFDARSRAYEYTLYVALVRQPLLNRQTWHVPFKNPLDVTAMQQASGLLRGTHDFASFGQPPQGDNTVREVLRSEITVLAMSGGQKLRYTIEANAFLYRMVRRIIGTLTQVGAGKLSIAEFEAAFHAADNTRGSQTAPPHGLCLTEVTFNERGDAR